MSDRNVLLRDAAIAVALLALGGCAVGPNYHAPRVETPAAFAEETAATQPSAPAAPLTTWWIVFNDEQLTGLIDRASENNLDLAVAAARLREARVLLVGSRAGLFPDVQGVGGYQANRTGQNVDGRRTSSGTAAGAGASSFRVDPDVHNYSAGFDASWEIDIFGGVRRSIEAAGADFDAAVANRDDVQVSLLAEVARNYIVLRGAQRQLEIVTGNLKTQDQTLELTRSRFKAGLTSDLDVARAEAQAMTTRSQIPPLEDQVHQAIRRLSVLCGENPETLTDQLRAVAPIPNAAPVLPSQLPSVLLRRRPDIRQAERQLAAETARIGVATADLFPRFTLDGTFAYESANVKNLFDSSSIGYGIGPAMRWQLLNFGRVQSNIKAQEFRTEQTLYQYEQTILLALEEVENSMGSYRREQARRDALASAVSSSRRAVDLADQLYRQGLTAFQDVLDAQRRLLEVESQLVTSDQTVSTNLVQLYKALGGGWDPVRKIDRGPILYIP